MSFMLSVTNKPIMQNVITPSVVMLNVVPPWLNRNKLLL